MNKKQLTLQNSSLFAELERKAKEIEILSIRLEEAEKKIKAFNEENEILKDSLEKADAENHALSEENKELERSLAEAKAKSVTTFAVIDESEPVTDFKALADESNIEIIKPHDEPAYDSMPEITETVVNTETVDTMEQAYSTEEASEPLSPSDEPEVSENSVQDTITESSPISPTFDFEVKKPESTLPAEDLLRDYGAKIIGRVTRVTAEVLSKVSAVNDDVAESLKTLALGKNESFKFQIIELAKKKDNAEKIMSEMELLADEAIVYLRSI